MRASGGEPGGGGIPMGGSAIRYPKDRFYRLGLSNGFVQSYWKVCRLCFMEVIWYRNQSERDEFNLKDGDKFECQKDEQKTCGKCLDLHDDSW